MGFIISNKALYAWLVVTLDRITMRIGPLTLGWIGTRTWVLLSGFGIIFYPESEFLFSDVRLYDWWAGNIADLRFPINDPMWQYPPLAAVVFLAGYLIAGNTVGFVFLALVADLAIFTLLIKRGSIHSIALPARIWVLSPLIMGPIFLGRFDVFVTLSAVVALLFVSSPRKFGIAIAIGALLKIWPILLLLASPRSYALKVLAWFVTTFTVGSLLLSLWWRDSFSFIGEQRSRGLQIESVGALPYQIWNAGPGSVTSGFQFGAIEIIASGTNLISLLVTVLGIILLGTLFYWRAFGKLESASPADVALLAVLISIVTSRVLSPQYMVWVFGLLAVCAFTPQKNFKRILILISLSAGIGQFIYPWWYISLQQGGVLAVAAHTTRIIFLIWATYLAWRNVQETIKQSHDPRATNLIS